MEFAESRFDWPAIVPFYRLSRRFRDAFYGGHKSADCAACTVHDRSKHHCVDEEFCCEGLSLALDAGQSSNEWSLFAVGFRSDATNGSIWHRQKLHVCEASAMFLSDPEQLKLGNFEEAMSRRSCVSLGFIFMESDTYTLYPLNLSI